MRVQRINAEKNLNLNKSTNLQRPTFGRNWSEHASWGANYIKETGKTNFKLFSFPDAKAVFVEVASKLSSELGNLRDRTVQIIASVGSAVVIDNVLSKDEDSKVYPMKSKGKGIFVAQDIDAKPDDKYRFVIVDKDNKINLVKDPYAKKQEDINGWSSVYDSNDYKWKNTKWLEGKDSRRIVREPEAKFRGLKKLVIEEVNIPTLTVEGTFESAKAEIDEIAKRGFANAIEVMPVENTYSKQWGYDGVDKLAVNEKLGGAKGFKEFVDYVHGKGLNVIADIVPNHMGPDGDYLSKTGPYETGSGKFGAMLNYEGKDNKYVRDWMVNAALYYANEFKVDGIRFDMTKETASDYLLKQIVEELNEHNPQVFTIAEDGRDNKLSVTRYDENDNPHNDKLDFIDMNIDFIHTRNWRSTPHAIGFDSEWDFPLMHAIKSSITHTNQTSLNEIDKRMVESQHRIKYVMSHDEIGNVDGTRLIPKIMAQYLNFFANMNGANDAEKGQRAAQMSQKMTQVIVNNPDITSAELAKIQSDFGSTVFYDKKTLTNAMKVALARQRLAQGTVMTIPGPKMFFQGDDHAELAHFKFFREFSDEREERANKPVKNVFGAGEKGYDIFIDEALPDSVINKDSPKGIFKNIKQQMIDYNKDLKTIVEENEALLEGDIVERYKEHDQLVHIHRLRSGDSDIVVIKNYADKFYDGNYSSLGFPKNGEWVEIFNSDDKKYGGGGKINLDKKFSASKQNLNLAANSIVILKKV